LLERFSQRQQQTYALRFEEEQMSMQNHGFQIEIDRANPVEWGEMLDLFDDANIYQTWSYGKVRWGGENLSHLVLKRDAEVLGMAQLRIVRPTSFKFGVAYLRWGPLCERRGRPLDPDVVMTLARALEQEYVNKRKLFLRILPNAFAGSARAKVMQEAFSAFTPEPPNAENTYRTIVLDLGPSVEELRKGLDRKWRNQLTRAEKNNLTVVTGTGGNEYNAFCQIYKNMMSRKAFDTTVNVEEFGRIQDDLAERHRMQILICKDQGTPVAGLVASGMGDSSIYLLGATSDAGLNSKGAYLLQWALIQRLKASGIRWYDLGGIDPEGNPGVYHFKNGMSGLDTRQMSPLVKSNSVVSSVAAKLGMSMQRALRNSSGGLQLARTLKQFVAGN
jgi:lipid II:glycine glycyltransferase (peptidoglycan interpeptide bridge formation enzyme)